MKQFSKAGGEEATPVEHQKEHKIGDFARKYGDYM